ncbi:dihydrofolate reductase family protein [Phenylobacterium sp.]|jgi:dihydrofolate reductase|uniref:dihydrofolate reductase family protein n=1 Tax=Phenylobacterium sp. TaxID=1871053 RepID=UPI002E373B61|nr:dihydrofolate reductase family protein [Phenylobacterium sp.]HEX4710620.1 dihydrofolate reductase family protein [Phenylobacterium sp.]
MGKLILQMQISVDGFVGAASKIDWLVWNWGGDCTWDDALKADFNAVFDSVDCILLSRKMAEGGYLDHWKNAAEQYQQDFYRFARRITDTRKVVVSNRLSRSIWPRTDVAKGNLSDAVAALKGQVGGDVICFGGIGLASSLLASGHVDELQLFINPACVGDGSSIFGPSNAGLLKLTSSKPYDCGIVVNCYGFREKGAAVAAM